VVGKPVGIMLAAWLARKCGVRLTITLPALAVGAATAGVGFTVSLLVATLAFQGDLLEEAKIGVLVTAVLSPAVAWLAALVLRRLPDEVRARQLGATAETIVDLADDVDPGVDHIRGRMDAPVTLLEYGDFECPYCAHAHPIITKLLEHHPDELRYVFRHLPLTDVHPAAQLAAESAEAVGSQGDFWAMHDWLLTHQDELAPPELYRHAADLGLDINRFADELRRRRWAGRVARDVQSADASGVSGTPTFFINGRRHQGVYDIDTLTRAVKAAATTAAT
jgi:protein-disulfide isomerase